MRFHVKRILAYCTVAMYLFLSGTENGWPRNDKTWISDVDMTLFIFTHSSHYFADGVAIFEIHWRDRGVPPGRHPIRWVTCVFVVVVRHLFTFSAMSTLEMQCSACRPRYRASWAAELRYVVRIGPPVASGWIKNCVRLVFIFGESRTRTRATRKPSSSSALSAYSSVTCSIWSVETSSTSSAVELSVVNSNFYCWALLPKHDVDGQEWVVGLERRCLPRSAGRPVPRNGPQFCPSAMACARWACSSGQASRLCSSTLTSHSLVALWWWLHSMLLASSWPSSGSSSCCLSSSSTAAFLWVHHIIFGRNLPTIRVLTTFYRTLPYSVAVTLAVAQPHDELGPKPIIFGLRWYWNCVKLGTSD